MDAKMEKDFIKGGAFLIEDREASEIFTPEDFTEEHKMIGETMTEFIDNEVVPRSPRHGKARLGKWRAILSKRRAILDCSERIFPKNMGGAALDQVSGVIIAEIVGRGGGFGTTFGAQTSIGVLPILYFGSEELKKKWIPQIVSGEIVTAYCLSEAGSGSDALGAKCGAKLSDDGTEYILNGEKMWISNGGFADVFIVFAKVDGEKEKFSAFVVEKSENCRPGNEEHKMGIKSSSTTPLILVGRDEFR